MLIEALQIFRTMLLHLTSEDCDNVLSILAGASNVHKRCPEDIPICTVRILTSLALFLQTPKVFIYLSSLSLSTRSNDLQSH